MNLESSKRPVHFLCWLLQWRYKIGHWTIQYSDNPRSLKRVKTSKYGPFSNPTYFVLFLAHITQCLLLSTSKIHPINHHPASAGSHFHPSGVQPTAFSVCPLPSLSTFICTKHCLLQLYLPNRKCGDTICVAQIYRINKGAHFAVWTHAIIPTQNENTTQSCCANASSPSVTRAVLSCGVGVG